MHCLMYSDRTKRRISQRKLQLKAYIGSHVCQGENGKARQDGLLEALVLANERIEKLEGGGQQLLDALERTGPPGGSARNEAGEEDGHASLVAARDMAKRVVDDGAFR